jgi:hypothetical protein
MRRALLVAGALLFCVGLLWPWISKLPLGRLPGDLVIDRPGLRFYAPLTTMAILSLILSLLLWLFRK